MALNIAEPWMWTAFSGFLIIMLALDLFVLGGRKAHRVSTQEALAWVIVWSSMAFGFSKLLFWYLNATVGHAIAKQKSLEFITGYLIEQSLSIDNMFVFVMIFKYFAVPPEFQRRVLLYGVLGAIGMRAVMIFGGVWLVSEFSWLLYIFGAFLIFTGLKMIIFADHEPDLDKNPLLRWLKSHLRMTATYQGEKFFVRQNGLLWATPLFLVLMLIEATDLVFAVDSIPAIFAVTTDPFIIFTSNLFAIMGLRSLYFLLADMASRFQLLKYGLAIVLVFIGIKMLITPWFHIPIHLSLGIVGGVIVLSILLSLALSHPKTRLSRKKLPINPSKTIDPLYDKEGRLIQVSIHKQTLVSKPNSWLIAMDGSKQALHALSEALSLGLFSKGFVHVINVQRWLSKEAADTHLEKSGSLASAKACELLDEAGISWSLHIIMGETAESIVHLAEHLNCQGIIVGSKGLGATQALLMGSIAYQVINLSKISVLVVR